jgi:NAD(P)-dependent dehydrogenase (short-subunit alcohol dehydrogenase family)
MGFHSVEARRVAVNSPTVRDNAFSLQGRTAAITGAASGIGRAIATEFIRAGATVRLIDVDTASLNHVVAELGPGATAHAADVASEPAVQACFAQLLSAGPLDILVNNAGVAHIGNVENTQPADFERLFRVNVQGVYLCTRAVIAAMATRGKGVIINLASVAGWAGLADRFAYSMTKGAVLAMTASVARDYVQKGIRCNSISPGRVHTPFVDGFLAANYAGREAEMFAKLAAAQPVGRMGQPSEVASLARFLASDEAAFITGSDYAIDGGFLRLHG